MDDLRIKRAPRIEAEITVLGRQEHFPSRSHDRVARQRTMRPTRLLPSNDCMSTVVAMRALGIKIEQPEPEMLIVHGKRRKSSRAERRN